MRRENVIAFRMLMLLIFAASAVCCTKDQRGKKVQSFDLCFDVFTSPNTKAQTGEDNSYAVWAYDSNSGESILESMPLQRKNGLWYPVAQYDWKEGLALDFYAASPMGYARFDSEKGVCFDSYDTSLGYDLLYVEPVLGWKAEQTMGLVSLTFKRAMSLVRIYLKEELPSSSSLFVKELSVDGLKHNGSFSSLPEPHWTMEGESAPLLLWEGQLDCPSEQTALCESYVLPQTAELDFTLLCDVRTSDSVLDNQKLSAKANIIMRPGKLYELYLTVTEHLTLKIERNII
ncbi:MAG: fimbrillin family protein [Candidatus Cryptobacteroides sp.]